MDSKNSGNLFTKLSELIENIVTSGQKQIEEAQLKELKKICRTSDACIHDAYNLLNHQLNQKHSEIRLSAFNIVRELFQRSHLFRELVIADFQQLWNLVLDIDPKLPLPPPLPAAKNLKLTAMKTIKEWNDSFGEGYKKLRIGFTYLKQSRLVDFEDIDVRTAQERQRNQEKEAKLEAMKKLKLKSISEEISENIEEISNSIVQLENGLSILVPNDLKSCDESETNHCESNSELFRAHGMTNSNFSLTIEVKKIKIVLTNDNRDLIQFLQEQYHLLSSRHVPLVIKWNISASKLGAEEHLQKRILDLKLRLESTISKYEELDLPCSTQADPCISSSESDSDLESVADKDGYEETVVPSYFPPTRAFGSEDQPGPSCSNMNIRKRKPKPTSKLPHDIELYEAAQKQMSTPTFSINPVESFWVSPSEDADNDPLRTAAILTQPVALSEEFNPVRWSCRAPMKSGKLCPRRDRRKCPLHGPIVARDELGNPKDPQSVSAPQNTVPDWQDPALLAEIKAATGVDLTMPVKGKRVKKVLYPNLTDLKALNNTSRSRLGKKVFKKSALKKVDQVFGKKEK